MRTYLESVEERCSCTTSVPGISRGGAELRWQLTETYAPPPIEPRLVRTLAPDRRRSQYKLIGGACETVHSQGKGGCVLDAEAYEIAPYPWNPRLLRHCPSLYIPPLNHHSLLRRQPLSSSSFLPLTICYRCTYTHTLYDDECVF